MTTNTTCRYCGLEVVRKGRWVHDSTNAGKCDVSETIQGKQVACFAEPAS